MCDDRFTIEGATVVCRQLGYIKGIRYHDRAHYGRGSGDILLDNVQCSGTEASLFDCHHNGIGIENCGHNEDVGVECQGTFHID